jgi:hypothetical protein
VFGLVATIESVETVSINYESQNKILLFRKIYLNHIQIRYKVVVVFKLKLRQTLVNK